MSDTAIHTTTDDDGFETAQYKPVEPKPEVPTDVGGSDPKGETSPTDVDTQSDNESVDGAKDDDGDESKRLQDLHKRVRLAEKGRREAEEALLRLRGEKPADDNADRQLEIQREAKRIAQTELEQQKVANVITKGRNEYGVEFDGYIRTMFETGQTQGIPEGIPQTISQMITDDLDNPTKVVQYLGKNPDKYEHLLNLTPHKQAVELARLSMTLDRKPTIRAAPAPIEPIQGSTKSSPTLEDMDMDDYHKIRSEQRAKRRAFN